MLFHVGNAPLNLVHRLGFTGVVVAPPTDQGTQQMGQCLRSVKKPSGLAIRAERVGEFRKPPQQTGILPNIKKRLLRARAELVEKKFEICAGRVNPAKTPPRAAVGAKNAFCLGWKNQQLVTRDLVPPAENLAPTLSPVAIQQQRLR